MAENILEFTSKGFSKVLFSGSGISVDACLDRADGIRVHDERQQALFLLLEQTGSVLFCFDVEEDSLYYLEVLSDGTKLERKISDFVKALHAARDSVEAEGQVFAQALLEARGKKTGGTVRYRGKVFSQTVCWNTFAPSIRAASIMLLSIPDSAVSISITFSPPYFQRKIKRREWNGVKAEI